MTLEDKSYQQKKSEFLEEICDNTRAIRRVTNRILDHLHEYHATGQDNGLEDYDPDAFSWKDLDNNDDMYS